MGFRAVLSVVFALQSLEGGDSGVARRGTAAAQYLVCGNGK